jgi:hypothetical protein
MRGFMTLYDEFRSERPWQMRFEAACIWITELWWKWFWRVWSDKTEEA